MGDDFPFLVSNEDLSAARSAAECTSHSASPAQVTTTADASMPMNHEPDSGRKDAVARMDADEPHPVHAAAGPDPAIETLLRLQSDVAALSREIPRLNGIIDRLHADNERLRRGETDALLQPLFRDLIKMSDDWLACAKVWTSRSEAAAEDVARTCREAAEDAQLILARHDVEMFVPEAATPFDRRLQRAVGKQPTTDPEQEGRIAAVRRTGYNHGDRVLRFAEVVVHTYDPAAGTGPSAE